MSTALDDSTPTGYGLPRTQRAALDACLSSMPAYCQVYSHFSLIYSVKILCSGCQFNPIAFNVFLTIRHF